MTVSQLASVSESDRALAEGVWIAPDDQAVSTSMAARDKAANHHTAAWLRGTVDDEAVLNISRMKRDIQIGCKDQLLKGI